MEYLLLALTLGIGFLVGTVAHEMDIHRCLKKMGRSRYSTFLGEIYGYSRKRPYFFREEELSTSDPTHKEKC